MNVVTDLEKLFDTEEVKKRISSVQMELKDVLKLLRNNGSARTILKKLKRVLNQIEECINEVYKFFDYP